MNKSATTSKILQDTFSPIAYASDLTPLIKAVANKRYVLLGEASHGTSEFYLWRSAITKQIIQSKDVTFIAVEGDWPACYKINRYIKGYPHSGKNAEEVLRTFAHWPTWMWANKEMIDLVEWLKNWNQELNPHKRIGFYGMDVYSLWESMAAVVNYLEKVDPQAADQAARLYACFEPYQQNTQRYGLATAYIPENCEQEAIRVLQKVQKNISHYPGDVEEKFNVLQNAFVAKQAESYYRSMFQGNATSWNNRDRSMVDTLYRLQDFYGAAQTAIVWAHNTHIGDATFTDMAENGMWNVGELLREEVGKDYIFSLGFSTYKGTVIAGKQWGSPFEVMRVPPAQKGSWDEALHQLGYDHALGIFPQKIPDELTKNKGQRAIGVVYDPFHETANYVSTQLGFRYDGLLSIDHSHALHPLHIPKEEYQLSETYPSAL